MEKILTIVIPTYNMQDYLRRCLDSLIVPEEQMKHLEVLVVNDGSKDNSSTIAHEYQDKYPDTFRVIDKENGNYGSCVNRGLKEAAGKYIKILDADDWFDKNTFTLYLEKLNGIEADLIITDYNFVSNKGRKNPVCYHFPINKILSFSKICTSDEFVALEMHAVTYLRENLISMNYHQTEGISYTDQEWMFEPMAMVNRVMYIPLNIYQYLLGREGQTVTLEARIKNISQVISIQEKSLNIFKKYRDSENPASVYLAKRLVLRCKYIYDPDILLGKFTQKNLIVSYDEQLKANFPDIYQESNDCMVLSSKMPYHYLRVWRKGKGGLEMVCFKILWTVRTFLRYLK